MIKVRFHAPIQTKHRIQIPAWLLLRHQILVGDLLHVNLEDAGVAFDTRVGMGFRVVIPRWEFAAIDGYWLQQPVVEVTLEFEERPDAQFAQAALEKIQEKAASPPTPTNPFSAFIHMARRSEKIEKTR